MEDNQKKLYLHYKSMAESGASSDIRKNGKINMEMMLKAYPQFAEPPVEIPKSKGKK